GSIGGLHLGFALQEQPRDLAGGQVLLVVMLLPVLDALGRIRFDRASAEGTRARDSLPLVPVAFESGRRLPVFIIPILLAVIVLLIAQPVGIPARLLGGIFLFVREQVGANRGDVDPEL